MRTIVHLSDLHFGRLEDRLVAPLVQRIRSLNPDLVAISGDFTQRARTREFQQAREFLDALPFRKLLVPGNHDVPLYNFPVRLVDPFRPYRRFIHEELEPVLLDEDMAIVGLNSARSLVFQGKGRLNRRQVERAVSRLRPVPTASIKVVVTHHPFDLPDGFDAGHLIGRASMAMRELASVGADLFLSGHLHVSHIGHAAERYKIAGHSALIVQAGTMSTRGRGELNTFNVLRVARPEMVVERYTWDTETAAFTRSWTGTFRHTSTGWVA
jgi:3',5'-cyclic AMP phosphodiesterase CpdA